jgi:Tol biopolymer transport system component
MRITDIHYCELNGNKDRRAFSFYTCDLNDSTGTPDVLSNLSHELFPAAAQRVFAYAAGNTYIRTMKRSLYLLSASLFCILIGNMPVASQIPYPLPTPDTAALRFLPGIVSMDSLDFNAAFSPDGKSFYFSRSKNRQSKIYVSHHDGVKWSEPVFASFTGGEKYAEADPIFAADGKLYFISNRPKDQTDTIPDYDIWFVSPLGDGRWSQPENMKSINTDSSEFYISFSRNGNLYFASSRPGGFGQEDIYVSELVKGRYTAPQNLGPSINTDKAEYDPCISSREDVLVFASSNRANGFGGADLYCSRIMGKVWLPALNLGATFNTKTREFCPYFSPDAKFFFYSSEGDVKWISMKMFNKRVKTLWEMRAERRR